MKKKVLRALKHIEKAFIKPAQFFNRDRYMRYLCWVYRNDVVFEETPPRFIACDVYFDNSAHIYVGSGTTITSKVNILTHDYSIDYGLMAINSKKRTHEMKYVKEVRIGKDVFIGQSSTILPGVCIGNNCVIGAGSLINRDIPDRMVAAGVPAKVIGSVDDWIEKRIRNDLDYIV